MPWATSDRKLELPPNWDSLRRQVGDRDGWICQWPRSRGGICGSPANQCDHKKRGSDHSPGNLWMLCSWHHRKKTESESAEERRRIAAKGRMPIGKHPGLL